MFGSFINRTAKQLNGPFFKSTEKAMSNIIVLRNKSHSHKAIFLHAFYVLSNIGLLFKIYIYFLKNIKRSFKKLTITLKL